MVLLLSSSSSLTTLGHEHGAPKEKVQTLVWIEEIAYTNPAWQG